MAKHPTSLQRALSFVWPQTIERFNHQGQTLTLDLYYNQFMLCTSEAIYSWGTRYKPFRIPFQHIKKELPGVNRFLLLGTGLGSALALLQQKYNCFPESVLVDHNDLILELSQRYMNLNTRNNVTWICNDAMDEIRTQQEKFDLIGIDLFNNMEVAHPFKQEVFFQQIAECLNPGGIAIFNHVFHSQNDYALVQKRMNMVFNHVQPITKGINTFTIARITK